MRSFHQRPLSPGEAKQLATWTMPVSTCLTCAEEAWTVVPQVLVSTDSSTLAELRWIVTVCPSCGERMVVSLDALGVY